MFELGNWNIFIVIYGKVLEMSLTDNKIEVLLRIGFGIKTEGETVTLDKNVLYSVIRKSYQYGANRDIMKTVWAGSKSMYSNAK